jgi:N6-adenosine-specific RNA methylase IME4
LVHERIVLTDGGPVGDLNDLIRAGVKFGTVYADPPWQFVNSASNGAAAHHYLGMTVEELCSMPVAELAARDSHLHLWTTAAHLFECLRIFAAWGFEYRSTFVWCKPQIGAGNYWRCSHELLLTGIRGNAKRFNDHSLKSWIVADRTHHSAKPNVVRSFIERASPGPRLELFGREPVPGWYVFGNGLVRP